MFDEFVLFRRVWPLESLETSRNGLARFSPFRVCFRYFLRYLPTTSRNKEQSFFPREFSSSKTFLSFFPIRSIRDWSELDCKISAEFGNVLSKFPGLISAADQPSCNRNVHRITRHRVSRVPWINSILSLPIQLCRGQKYQWTKRSDQCRSSTFSDICCWFVVELCHELAFSLSLAKLAEVCGIFLNYLWSN